MKKVMVVNTDSKLLSHHQCQSWEECLEWVDSFLNFNSLSRIKGDISNNAIMTVWAEERK